MCVLVSFSIFFLLLRMFVDVFLALCLIRNGYLLLIFKRNRYEDFFASSYNRVIFKSIIIEVYYLRRKNCAIGISFWRLKRVIFMFIQKKKASSVLYKIMLLVASLSIWQLRTKAFIHRFACTRLSKQYFLTPAYNRMTLYIRRNGCELVVGEKIYFTIKIDVKLCSKFNR